jgi:NAD(P)-dependent dehydrogenase (short-subunit alcohol dehydrogenase family)
MAPAHDLSGKTVLLTGASRGIGAATARSLGAAGAHLVAHYGSYREGAEEAVADIPPGRKLLVQADLARPGASRELWREALAWRGRIDVLVANAGIAPPTPLDGSDEEWDGGWEETLRVNVLEPASLVREAVRHFLEAGGGTVISLSSWAAQRGSAIASLPAYAASKAAIRNLTQTVARNYAAEGILAFVVAPGIVRTRMSEISAVARGGIDAVNAALAMGEMVPPEEVAEVITYLATGTVRHLTGATLDVNGAAYIR